MAHPEVIKKKTIDLKTDTIIVKETGTASAMPRQIRIRLPI